MSRPLNEIAKELATYSMLKKYIAKLEAEAKGELQQQLPRGTAYATLDSGVEVATIVSVAESTDIGLEVVDQQAFLEWVITNRPSAVIAAVRDSDKKSILAEALKTGDAPDGVAPTDPKAAYVQVKAQTPAQIKALTQAWMNNEIDLDIHLKELTGGQAESD